MRDIFGLSLGGYVESLLTYSIGQAAIRPPRPEGEYQGSKRAYGKEDVIAAIVRKCQQPGSLTMGSRIASQDHKLYLL